ncbi:hypothetical protein EFY79_19440 [Hanamia caeni]|jgi:hypothetical protein|uniref:Uncharacterized protein n=1 Tax=Hanamia caeni TaxID=2294116 RepID=A0A3M9N7N7_9BACT|nr:hypothetical protein EFY79_19440 [Hanamia caeni]
MATQTTILFWSEKEQKKCEKISHQRIMCFGIECFGIEFAVTVLYRICLDVISSFLNNAIIIG